MPRTHLRAAVGAVFAVTLVVAVVIAGTASVGDAESSDDVATAPGAPSTDAPPADGQAVLAEIARQQRLEAFAAEVRAHEAEQARQLEALAAAEQARAEREAMAGIPDAYWDRMAQCETAGDWSMVGSRYSGGLGFYNGTWDAFGGREFAARAGQATREQQIVVANRVANDVGLSGWGCLDTVGRP